MHRLHVISVNNFAFQSVIINRTPKYSYKLHNKYIYIYTELIYIILQEDQKEKKVIYIYMLFLFVKFQ